MLQSATLVVGSRTTSSLLAAATVTSASSTSILFNRGIKSKVTRTINPVKSPPWPYKDVGYSYYHQIIDGTKKRFDENSRLILVEGNIGSGKSKLCKELADQLDFHYIPEFSMDNILITGDGFDVRTVYDHFPKSFQTPDVKMFYEKNYSLTQHQLVRMQHMMLFGRHEQYLNALAHIMNTGQGVVLERSVFSDFVFINAMMKKKLITPQFFRHYHRFRRSVIDLCKFFPHLVIYLDTPVDQCLENIKQRGHKYELNNPILDREYLTTIEQSYQDMLSEIHRHSKMLVYDWPTTSAQGIDRVVEDVEHIDFDFFVYHSMTEFEEWHMLVNDFDWAPWRRKFTEKSNLLFTVWYNNVSDRRWSSPDVAGSQTTLEEREQWHAALKQLVYKDGYAHGYHPNRANKNWKNYLTHLRFTNLQSPHYWEDHFWRDLHFTTVMPSILPFIESDFTGAKFFNPEYNAHH